MSPGLPSSLSCQPLPQPSPHTALQHSEEMQPQWSDTTPYEEAHQPALVCPPVWAAPPEPPRPSQDQAAVSDRTIQVLYSQRGTSKGESAALRARARPLLVGSLTASQARSRPISGSGHQFTGFQPAYSQKENIRVCLRK